MRFFCENREFFHSPIPAFRIKWIEVMKMLFGNLTNCGGNSENSNSWWIIVIAIIVLYFLVFDKGDRHDCCDSCSPGNCC